MQILASVFLASAILSAGNVFPISTHLASFNSTFKISLTITSSRKHSLISSNWPKNLPFFFFFPCHSTLYNILPWLVLAKTNQVFTQCQALNLLALSHFSLHKTLMRLVLWCYYYLYFTSVETVLGESQSIAQAVMLGFAARQHSSRAFNCLLH